MYRFFIPAFALVFAFGLLVGWTLAAWDMHVPPPLILVEDEGQAQAAVVRLEGIRNGALLGTVSGDVRLVADGQLVLFNSGGGFVIDDKDVLTNIIHIEIPNGMNFVASKRGKKYYPVESTAGQSLSIENRVYFHSADGAEKAGYVP